jgi:hypothetical protein
VVIAGTKVFNIFADLGNQLDRLGLLAKHSGDDVAWWEKNIFEVSEMLVEMVTGTDDATKSAHRMGKEVKTASEIMREDAVSASEALEERLSSLKEEMDAANAAAEELESTFFDQARGALDLDQKLDDLKSAIESATEAADDHKKVSIEERTELRNVANTSLDVIEAMISQGKSTDSIVGKTDKARESFIKVAQEMGYTEEEAIDLADKYGLIPKDVKTKVDLINDEKAKAKAAAVAAAIAKIKSKIVTISINEVHTKIYRTGEGGYFFEAHGGNIGGQKPSKLSTAATGGVRSNDVMVGERRPEVVQLPFGTRVIPSLEQARGPFPSMTGRSAGGGGVNVHVYVQGSIRSDKELVGIIRDEFLSGGLRDLFPPPTTGGNN